MASDERAGDPAHILAFILRGGGGANARQYWKHGRQIAGHPEVLDWAAVRAREIEPDSLPARAVTSAGGEHAVRYDPESGRVVKFTKPGLYGAHAEDAGAYLQRWALSNRIFGEPARIEGIIKLPGEDDYRMVISQRFVKGRDSTPEEVSDYMMGKGFRRTQDGRWVNPVTGVAVWDAARGNAITSKDGQVHPIDFIAEPVGKRELEEVRGMMLL